MRSQEGALNKAAIIILNLRSGLSSSRLQWRSPRFAHLRETFRVPSGSINTVGQALAQLSLSTSDSARSKRYDLSLDHSASQLLHQIDIGTPCGEPTLGLDGRTYIRGRGSPQFRLERFTLSDAKAAPGRRCVFGVRYFFRNLPSFARVESNHSQAKSILIARAFFHAKKQRCSQSRLIEVKD
jgi:hypothetical protein